MTKKSYTLAHFREMVIFGVSPWGGKPRGKPRREGNPGGKWGGSNSKNLNTSV